MPRQGNLGEFEQLVLLAVLQLGDAASGPAVGRHLEETVDRQVSRGALYSTFDRLERKGLLRWEVEAATSERAGHRSRRFEVTPAGVEALRAAREALLTLWRGLDDVLAGPA